MSRVVDWIFEKNWAITKEALQTILSIADRDRGDIGGWLKGQNADMGEIDTRSLSAKIGTPLQGAPRVEVRENTAIIPVIGPIFPRANILTAISGATSLQSLSNDFNQALSDPNIESIIFNIDSPGGEVTGVTELANMIFNSRGRKPIISYVFGNGASAAYWIGSAADELVVSATAQVGSIGVIAALKDTTAKDEKAGVKNYEIVSSISPYKRIDPRNPDGLSRIQSTIDNLAGVLVGDIAKFRGTSKETVLTDFGKGDVFIGALSVGQGLADRVGSLEQIISELSNTNQMEGGFMDLQQLKSEHPSVYEQAFAEGKASVGQVSDETIEKARKEGALSENQRIKAIEAVPHLGAEKVVAECKFNMEETASTVSLKILEAKQAETSQAQAALLADGQEAHSASQETTGSTGQEDLDDAERTSMLSAMVDGLNKKSKSRAFQV